MELITAINALEKWRSIMEWDEHIKELPNELKEYWNIILKVRDKGKLADKIGLGSSQYWKWCIGTLGVLEKRYPHPLVVKFLVDILSYQDEAVSQIQGRK